MIDLNGVARHLRLSVEQLRVAADLLQQGYHPAFIERYRADETGCLPRTTLWTLKLEIDRQMRLEAARQKAREQLPKDAELDDEGQKGLARATTEVEIEAALRAFRARRALQQSQERDSQAGHLLEMLIAYDGPKIDDLPGWVAEQLSVDKQSGAEALQQTSRLIGNLIQCDTLLNEKLRRAIQRKACVSVEFCEPATAHPTQATTQLTSAEAQQVAVVAEQVAQDAVPQSNQTPTDTVATEIPPATAVDAETGGDQQPSAAAHDDAQPVAAAHEPADAGHSPADADHEHADADHEHADADHSHADADHEHGGEDEDVGSDAHDDHETEQPAGKSKRNAKLTPRQRRRRWLIAMLQPMKSLKQPLTKLTAYQQLMLGRGRRSQLVKTNLEYDASGLVSLARDTFVSDKHPLSAWFSSSVESALDHALRSKLESDAVADLEELAQEKLLENAADQLRQHLMRRPIRGHTILLVDTVGPKTASIAIVGPQGEVLATDELPCSAQSEIVNQNVVKLGELAHQYRVTLVALTNGPARRFLVLTVRELMKQSVESGLRWTMADRGGAEAYAAGRIALKELSAFNRRDRAAIWIARCLQNPLAEILKIDINRMRLGSYQRELPQDSLKKLVHEIIADCVCSRGIDTHHAAINELLFVPGVAEDQAKQIVALASEGRLESRSQLCEAINDWPEMQSRQALGWLRVFASEQPLDATAIHPEDYRLAQRLIDHTEFAAPPAHPESWTKQTRAAMAVAQPAGDPVQTSPGPEQAETLPHAEPIEAHEQAESHPQTESATAESQQSSDGEAASSQAADTQQPSSTEDSSPVADHPPAEDGEAPVVTESEEAGVSMDSESVAQQSTDVESSLSFKSANKPVGDALPRAKPEYPEDVSNAEPSHGPDIDIEKLARGWQVGREKLRWIAKCLNDPFADSRLAGTPLPLTSEMPSLQSLEVGQCVWAVVVGVADFGAFVELSPDCSGLIHISRLSANYVEDPHQCVQVGDLLLTWVVSKDEKKNRVALTALSPAERVAAEAEAQHRRDERRQGPARRGQPAGAPAQQASANRGERPAGGRPRQSQAPAGASSSGDRGRGQRGPRSGSGQHDSRGRGRGQGPRTAKTVVVTSKKPKAPISEAMKEGEVPLRSFSDLLQFYEAKRSDEPTANRPPASSPPIVQAAPVVEQPVVEQSEQSEQAAEQSRAVSETTSANEPSAVAQSQDSQTSSTDSNPQSESPETNPDAGH